MLYGHLRKLSLHLNSLLHSVFSHSNLKVNWKLLKNCYKFWKENQNRMAPVKCKIIGCADYRNCIRAFIFEMSYVNETVKSASLDNCRNIYRWVWIWTCVVRAKCIHESIWSLMQRNSNIFFLQMHKLKKEKLLAA